MPLHGVHLTVSDVGLMIVNKVKDVVRLSVAVLGVSACFAVSALAETDRKSYRVSIAGFPVGTAQYDATLGDGRYQIQGFMGSTGFFGAFLASRYSGAVVGQVRSDGLRPERFRGRFEQSRKFAEVDVLYAGGAPTQVSRKPNRPRLPHEVAASEVGRALDPISALYVLLRDVPENQLCTQAFTVFEGSRTSRIRLQRAQTSDGSVVCNGEYRRIDGFTKTQMADRVTFPFQLNYAAGPNGAFVVQEFLATTFWGTARAVLREN